MFTYERKAHYHETDQMGVIHHANYVKWMEEARVEFMDELGLSYKAMEEAGIVSPVTGLELDYKRPIAFDERVSIRLHVLKYTGVSLEVAYEIRNATQDALAARASSRHCFLKDGKLVSLKKLLPALDENLRANMATE